MLLEISIGAIILIIIFLISWVLGRYLFEEYDLGEATICGFLIILTAPLILGILGFISYKIGIGVIIIFEIILERL